MEQQVNVQATLVLSLPAAWDQDTISTHIRARLGSAFTDNLPGDVGGESPVNFTFQEEAELYGNNECQPAPPAAEPAKPFLLAKLQTLTLLAIRGIARVEIEYDGYGDEGQVNNIAAFRPDGSDVKLAGPESIAAPGAQFCGPYNSLQEALDDFAWTIIQHFHEGFHNNDGGHGTFVIDVPGCCITLEHYDRYVESRLSETEV
jgi:hypothetical protein